MASIQWLGHAAFKIEHQGFCILVDPWLNNPKAPADKKVGKVDAILISHGHFDHVGDTVTLAQEHKCKVFAIYEVGEYVKTQGVAEDQVVTLNKGGTVDIGGGCKATMVQAVHSGACGGAGPLCAGGEAGWVIHLPNGHRIYHSGDTDVFGDMKLLCDLYSPDVACLCIGGHYTMGPHGAAHALNNLLHTVKIVLPMHFGTFPPLKGTPAELQALVKRKDVNICKLNPGESLDLTGRHVEKVFADLV